MKKFTRSGLCTLAAGVSLVVAGVALGQSERDNPEVEIGQPDDAVHGAHHDLYWLGSLPYNRFHADDLVGSEVRGLENETMGEVSTLVFDEDGRILAAVVETGGMLGLGGKSVAIPWEYVRPVQTGEREYYLLVEIDPESLENAPEYDRD